MDVIDTTLRVGSREKLHPKHGYDEEVGAHTQRAVAGKLHSEKLGGRGSRCIVTFFAGTTHQQTPTEQLNFSFHFLIFFTLL